MAFRGNGSDFLELMRLLNGLVAQRQTPATDPFAILIRQGHDEQEDGADICYSTGVVS